MLFRSNPRYSAKLAWNQMLKQLSLVTGMMIGNVMCRSYLIDGQRLPDKVVDELREIVRGEGSELCSLENDEIDNLFRRNFNYFDRLFTHRTVASIAHAFASELESRRTFSAQEVLDHLRDLAGL